MPRDRDRRHSGSRMVPDAPRRSARSSCTLLSRQTRHPRRQRPACPYRRCACRSPVASAIRAHVTRQRTIHRDHILNYRNRFTAGLPAKGYRRRNASCHTAQHPPTPIPPVHRPAQHREPARMPRTDRGRASQDHRGWRRSERASGVVVATSRTKCARSYTQGMANATASPATRET
jgi:hypothetical protein